MGVLLKVSQQTAWQLVSKTITAGSTLLILAIISQQYGILGTGVYTLALTYLAFFYMAVDLGLNAHLLPHLVNNEKLVWQKLLGSRLLLSVLVTVISLILLPFLSFGNSDYQLSVLVGSLTIICQGIYLSLQGLYQSQQRYDLVAKAMLVSTPVTVVLIYLMAQSQTQLPYLFLAHLVGWAVFTVTAFVLTKGLINKLTPVFDAQFLLTNLKAVWPISLTLVVNTLYFRLDSFLLSYFHNFSEVGVYNLAYQFFQTALVVPTFIMNSYYPLLIQGIGIRVQGLVKAGFILAGLGIVGTITTWLLSPILVPLVAGSQFTGSVEALKVLALSFPGFFISSLLMWVLIGLRKYKLVLVIYTLGLLVNFSLNYLYIPRGSYLAASWVTVVCEYLILIMQVVSLWSLVFSRKTKS